MSDLICVDKEKMDSEARTWLPQIINSFGTGEHPWVGVENFQYCALEYAIDCTKKAIATNLPENRIEIAKSILNQLESQV